MRILLLTMLLSACKLTTLSSDDLRRTPSDHAVFLHVSPAGMHVDVPGALGPGNIPLPQAFYRLRTSKYEFRGAQIDTHPLPAAPLTFEEVVLAWESHSDTWLCFLKDVTGSRSIDPTQETSCYRQDTRHSYLRQFVEWCIKDNKYHQPFFTANAAPYCVVGKVSENNRVRIPLRCFTGNANMCFPPPRRRQAGRGFQRVPVRRRFKADEYHLSEYLRASGKTFTAFLDDIYAQASDCRDGDGMDVRTFDREYPFYCHCPRYKKVTLNGQQKKCGSTGHAYFFPSLD